MYILTNAQMREADHYTIEELGVHSLLLMERAGTALADEAEKMSPNGKIVCLCGGGNNGGDGFVCARILKSRGREVEVVCSAENFSADCRANMEKWLSLGGEILPELTYGYGLIVDCLYGTGFHGSLSGADAENVSRALRLRENGVKILSADIPSGVNGDNGQVLGVVMTADKTLCIGEIKAGVLLGDGIDHAGKIQRADIGIEVKDGVGLAQFINRAYAREILPKRPRYSHKGKYGRAAIVAGSETYMGAAYLSASACLRAGAGYTTLFVPSALVPAFALKAPEVLLKISNEGTMYAFNASVMSALQEYDCVAYGMGMGVSEDVARGAAWLLLQYQGKLILDADGLNSLACYHHDLPALFRTKKCDVLLTPHAKEFSRLSGLGLEYITLCGLVQPKELAQTLGVNILLKNAVSVISDGARVSVNASGCSGQAKAGSGDVLAGVIAGLCAMGLSAFDAGVLGSYLTGKAAEFASETVGEYSMTASDVIAYLGRAFLYLTEV
ncbi:MAG: NAD(P)H-hydrate dehydratase [Clostridiales bacterium]|nr:NAD(P)H-hydrate dehydratase [Clostridiales bacterium]